VKTDHRRLAWGFGIPITVLIALSVLSYRSLVASAVDAGWVRHTHEVLERLAELRSALQDVENGQPHLPIPIALAPADFHPRSREPFVPSFQSRRVIEASSSSVTRASARRTTMASRRSPWRSTLSPR
jgi:hypothetical protein